MSLMKESKRLAQEMKNYKGTCEDINTYDDIIASDDEVFRKNTIDSDCRKVLRETKVSRSL